MPTMEITPEMVGPDRTRLGLIYIETLMLWPHDPEQCAEAMKTGTATFIHDALQSVPAAQRSVSSSEWLDWIGLAADAMPLRIVQRQAQQAYVHGIIAGELLCSIVGEHATGNNTKIQSLKNEIVEYCEIRGKSSRYFDISTSTLENTVWKRYKPVSHLWASYLATALDGERTFPCTLEKFPYFLGLAEYFFRAGKNIRPLRRGEPVLRPDEQWTLPSGLDVPLIDVAWGERRTSLDRSKRQ